jgi:hypothetical protein
MCLVLELLSLFYRNYPLDSEGRSRRAGTSLNGKISTDMNTLQKGALGVCS